MIWILICSEPEIKDVWLKGKCHSQDADSPRSICNSADCIFGPLLINIMSCYEQMVKHKQCNNHT